MTSTHPPQNQKEASANAFERKMASQANAGIDYLLTAKEVCEWLGRSHASLYRDISDGQIPQPIKLGRSSRWPVSEIRALIERAKAKRDGAPTPAEVA